MSKQLIQKYYEYFNSKEWENFFKLLDTNIIHEINQGNKEIGINLFKKFLNRMNECYDEKISNIIIFNSDLQNLYAVQYTVSGIYLKTDHGLPAAHGQTYEIRGAAFFEIENQKITAITNYYNLNEWIEMIQTQKSMK
jgi:steroid delta-isomerase-like uncharacterized protein